MNEKSLHPQTYTAYNSAYTGTFGSVTEETNGNFSPTIIQNFNENLKKKNDNFS